MFCTTSAAASISLPASALHKSHVFVATNALTKQIHLIISLLLNSVSNLLALCRKSLNEPSHEDCRQRTVISFRTASAGMPHPSFGNSRPLHVLPVLDPTDSSVASRNVGHMIHKRWEEIRIQCNS